MWASTDGLLIKLGASWCEGQGASGHGWVWKGVPSYCGSNEWHCAHEPVAVRQLWWRRSMLQCILTFSRIPYLEVFECGLSTWHFCLENVRVSSDDALSCACATFNSQAKTVPGPPPTASEQDSEFLDGERGSGRRCQIPRTSAYCC